MYGNDIKYHLILNGIIGWYKWYDIKYGNDKMGT